LSKAAHWAGAYFGTHLYFWVERGTVRVKCLAQEYNTMSLARTPAQTRDEHTNHEAMGPPLIEHMRAR